MLDDGFERCQDGQTYRVATAVDTEVRGHSDTTAEVEDGVQDIKADDKKRVNHERLLDACRNKVEQRQHAEDRDKHVVVDDRRIARVCSCDHVTDKRHDEKGPDELHGELAYKMVRQPVELEAYLEGTHGQVENLDDHFG